MPRKNLLAARAFDLVVTLFALLLIRTQFDALRHREGDVLDLRVHRLARPRSDLFLHLLTFLAMYFVENKHLDQASEHRALFFNDEVSADAVQLRRWFNWV